MNAAADRAGVSPARIHFDDDGVPHAPDFGDVYHSRAGAALQAQAVFLTGNGLPQRWNAPTESPADTPFTVLETGLGLGHNFLTTLQAWLNQPERHVQRLLYVAVEQFPPSPEALSQAHRSSNDPQRQRLASELLAQWPPCMPGSHTLTFDEGRVVLRLWLGEASHVLPRLQAQVDAVYLDGFAPSHNPTLWSPQLLRQVARLSRPGATLATWSTAGAVRLALTQAGYVCHKRPGFGGKRERLEAHYQPRWHPPAPAAFAPKAHAAQKRKPHPPHAVIVGGGLAGASTAHALARRGWRCTVLDAASAPASGASGNPAGLLHGIVHPEDGTHARWLRSAALYAHGQLGPLLQHNRLPGQLDGYVRLLDADADAAPPAPEALGVDERYAQTLTRSALNTVLGWTAALHGAEPGGVLFPHGGWISPAALVRWWLQAEGIHWQGSARVDRLKPCPDSDVTRWLALDDHGHALAEPADAMVVANASAALPLLQRSLLPSESPSPLWWLPALRAQRGQISQINRAHWLQSEEAHALMTPPQRPVSRYAYALDTGPAGDLVFGATHQWDDDDPGVRDSDHRDNLTRLMAILTPQASASHDEAALIRQREKLLALPWQGRTGWRCMSPDRLPLVGRVPQSHPPEGKALRRPHANHHLARVDGLYLHTALGSRGLTLAPLLGEALACLISGEALPVDTRLMDALEPARFALKALSRS